MITTRRGFMLNLLKTILADFEMRPNVTPRLEIGLLQSRRVGFSQSQRNRYNGEQDFFIIGICKPKLDPTKTALESVQEAMHELIEQITVQLATWQPASDAERIFDRPTYTIECEGIAFGPMDDERENPFENGGSGQVSIYGHFNYLEVWK